MAKLPVPKFNLRKRNATTETLISLLFRYRGNRLVHSTGYSILPCEWDFDNHRPIEIEYRADLFKIGNKLDELKKVCKDIYIENDYGNISVEDFKKEIDRRTKEKPINPRVITTDNRIHFFDFMDAELVEFQEAGMNEDSLKAIKPHVGIIKSFGKFLNSNDCFNYEDVDWNLRLKLIDWLASKQVQLSYGNRTLKILRQFLEAARRKKIHSNTDYLGKGWTVPRKKARGQHVFFDQKELARLAEIKFTGHLDKIRDIVLIGAGTGQRHSDFSIYIPEQFSISHRGVPILSVISDKTDTPAKIPLNIFPWLIPVLEKHNYTTPKMSMQKFNDGIKELAELVEFNNKLLVVKQYMGRQARVEKFYVEKYKLVSSHLCRRSFATNLYRMGFNLSVIMPMTGHASESQLRDYIGIDAEQNAEEVGLLFMNKGQANMKLAV